MKPWPVILPVASLLWATLAASAATPPSPDRIRELGEMSVEQRRVFLRGYPQDWRTDTDDRRGVAAPPLEKAYPADARRLDLVRPVSFTVGAKTVRDAIRDRRSVREYSAQDLSLEELSYLLWATQGISRIDRDDKGRVVAQFRTVPSGGARHPFETYLVVNRVVGLKPGLYRYLPVEHQLLVLREDQGLADHVTAACYGQAFTGKSAVTFIWSAIPYRTQWHYGCIAEKLVAVDAGHVCQNLYLAADSIGAGCCAVLGYHQAKMDALIGLDGKDEFVIYLAAVGKLHATSKP